VPRHQRDRLIVAAAVAAVLLLVGFSAWRHRAVRRAEERTTELLSHARDVVVVVDHDGIVSFVSPAVGTMLGHDPEAIVGSTLDDILSDKSATAARAGLTRAVEDGASSVLGVQVRHANGTRLWFDLHLVDRPHPDIDGVLVTCHEVGARRELEHELHERARHDALTRLGNRLAFDEALRVAADREGSLAVMMIDLDHFKPLNDSLGHDAGDAALKLVAQTMSQQVRHGDVVCRLGGDEFGVIAPDIDLDAATQLAERLVDRITDAWTATDNSIPLGASAGVVVGDAPMDRPEHLLREADSAMYKAKLAGGGRVVALPVAAQTDETHTASITRHDGPRRGTSARRSSGRRARDRPFASTKEAGRLARPRRRWRNAATWLLTALLMIGLVVGGAHLNDQRTGELEDERVANRTQVVRSITENVSGLVDLSALPELAASAPWPIDEAPAVVEFVLGRWANSGLLGNAPLAAVTDLDGNVLLSYPADVELAIGPDDPDWQGALDGRPVMSHLIDDGERLRLYYVIPLRIDGTVDHALVLGADPVETTWSANFASLGALTPGPGGLATVDDRGVAYSAWDPDLVGTQLVDPAVLAGLESGDIHVDARAGELGDQVVIAQWIPGSHRPNFVIWNQSREAMFADLRAGQTARDVALFAVVLVALAGLALVNHRREVLLRRSERLTDTLLQQAHDVVIVTGPDLTVRFVSDAASRHLGVDRASNIGRPLGEVLGAAPATKIAERLAETSPGQAISIDRVTVPARDGGTRQFDIDVADLRRHRSISGYLLTCHETSDRARLESLLAAQADSDPLTGLANRAHFGSRLDQLAERRTHQAGADAVVFIDLDHFKPVNDEFGHQAGDHLLQILARRLEATVRDTDIVCRLGGDEFAVLLADCDLETAEATVERLLHAIREPVTLHEGVVALDASIGVALSRSEVTNPEQLVREADQAMYAAKRAGRGRYVLEH
jgi:diguanylate cyclase (GGDEF)-like protein/PAS domain S-box-containing protein